MNPHLEPFEIVSQAPTRISFAGGGTDVSPFPETYGGAVVNATISIFMSARLRMRTDSRVIIHSNTRPKPIEYDNVSQLRYDGTLDFIKAVAKTVHKRAEGFEVYLYSPLPLCSGLGGSGAMCVALLDAFAHLNNRRLNNYELAEMAFDIETNELKNAGGRQDQYAASFGGFNHFEFHGKDHVRVNRLELHHAVKRVLNQALMLVWLGNRQTSGTIIEDQTTSLKNGGQTLKAMQHSKELVPDMCEALSEADIPRIGRLINELWEDKKRFCSQVSNSYIEGIIEKLRQAGALGTKITGAGGGGHLLICCEMDQRDAVATAAEEAGLRVVPFTFVAEGVMTWQSVLRTIHDPSPTH